ncbi:hypothetical protein VC83_08596 [Pseudogymnoascus destructans]|uniref:Uncharacterized protein n=1 Tax=Pseudogymnoascus destructans TaxID=655981 RepID=A0A177A115_9PEZI|nr:uncharacterized protein VC83_08596 [Pseudogymnoascus destructans]OAF54971.1 hypothetical protein VC83_08596 [Pseudogymnoascus destructans]
MGPLFLPLEGESAGDLKCGDASGHTCRRTQPVAKIPRVGSVWDAPPLRYSIGHLRGIGVHAATLVLVGEAVEPGNLRTVMLQLVDYAWGHSCARRRDFLLWCILDRKMARGAARCDQNLHMSLSIHCLQLVKYFKSILTPSTWPLLSPMNMCPRVLGVRKLAASLSQQSSILNDHAPAKQMGIALDALLPAVGAASNDNGSGMPGNQVETSIAYFDNFGDYNDHYLPTIEELLHTHLQKAGSGVEEECLEDARSIDQNTSALNVSSSGDRGEQP